MLCYTDTIIPQYQSLLRRFEIAPGKVQKRLCKQVHTHIMVKHTLHADFAYCQPLSLYASEHLSFCIQFPSWLCFSLLSIFTAPIFCEVNFMRFCVLTTCCLGNYSLFQTCMWLAFENVCVCMGRRGAAVSGFSMVHGLSVYRLG